jgi:hypothetical protein
LIGDECNDEPKQHMIYNIYFEDEEIKAIQSQQDTRVFDDLFHIKQKAALTNSYNLVKINPIDGSTIMNAIKQKIKLNTKNSIQEEHTTP